jgi:hypothetical protein
MFISPASGSAAGDSLRWERRRSARHALQGQVTSVHIPAPNQLSRKICSLRLLNLSDDGLGAVCGEPIPRGRPITIYFTSHGPERGFEMVGVVTRCQPHPAGGYDLGVQFAVRAAA